MAITSIYAGGAHSSEKGGLYGEPGDQTGGEVSYQSYDEATFKATYYGMYVFRPKDASGAAKMASLMVQACNNKNIGYSQNLSSGPEGRQAIFKYGANSSIRINCDCSSLVSYCITTAGVAKVNTNISGLLSTLSSSTAFYSPFPISQISFSANPPFNGDVLVRNGHTEMVCSGNPRQGTDDEGVTGGMGGGTSGLISGGNLYGGLAVASASNSTSALVNYVNRLTCGDSFARGAGRSKITIHTAKTIGDIYALAALLNSTEKTYNYGIDVAGTIGLFVDEDMCTPSSNDQNNDMVSVNIICMNTTLEPDYEISDECFTSLVNLCEDICRRNFMFELRYSGNPSSDNLTLHSEFEPDSECPGPYVEGKIQELVDTVNLYLSTEVGVNYKQVSATLASNQTEALKVQSTININSINPYVVMPGPEAININYAALRIAGVVGVMFDAGERFTSSHELSSKYRTEKLYIQTLEAKQANMPHAYIYTTHARDVAELREEAYWFHFPVVKYPPKLGVWLRCDFDVDSDTAQELVDEWYEFFVDWGLKSKCGLRCTMHQATKIGWPKQCNYMPLWLEGEDSEIDARQEILTPSFFKLDTLRNYGFDMTTSSIGAASSTRYNNVNDDRNGAIPGEQLTAKTLTDGSKEIQVPQVAQYTGMKKYENYAMITNVNTRNYQITHGTFCTTDEKGFRKVDGRFLIAVTTGVTETMGTYIDLILENGTKIECIAGDSKGGYSNEVENLPGNNVGGKPIFTTIGSSWDCSEFLVDKNKLDPTSKKMGDVSYAYPGWRSPVKTIIVYNKNWF